MTHLAASFTKRNRCIYFMFSPISFVSNSGLPWIVQLVLLRTHETWNHKSKGLCRTDEVPQDCLNSQMNARGQSMVHHLERLVDCLWNMKKWNMLLLMISCDVSYDATMPHNYQDFLHGHSYLSQWLTAEIIAFLISHSYTLQTSIC